MVNEQSVLEPLKLYCIVISPSSIEELLCIFISSIVLRMAKTYEVLAVLSAIGLNVTLITPLYIFKYEQIQSLPVMI